MKIAVIGAGLAGLGCARRLVERDHHVTVFERADGPGGRVATMRTEIGGFDHGAQYLTTRDPVFAATVEAWSRQGVVEPWPIVARSIDAIDDRGPARHAASGRTLRWVGAPGMSALPTFLATGLDVHYGMAALGVDRVATEHGAPSRWSVRCANAGDAATIAVTEGLFDAVVIAVPAEPATMLLAPSPTLARQSAVARIEPCWALMVGFAEPIATDLGRIGDAAFVNSGRLAWIARESSKPERRLGERWTVHAQSAWSVEHFDDDPEDAKAKLLRAFHEATGTIEQPVYAAVHRWRHALARTSLGCEYLWDAERRIGACGDWCRGYRVEDAWLSGLAMAEAVDGG
jgi:predicted NAD/FAD-dependent oxidoreductase